MVAPSTCTRRMGPVPYPFLAIQDGAQTGSTLHNCPQHAMSSEAPIDYTKRNRKHLRLEQAHSAYEIQKVGIDALKRSGSRSP